jgi:hypothetical protein
MPESGLADMVFPPKAFVWRSAMWHVTTASPARHVTPSRYTILWV